MSWISWHIEKLRVSGNNDLNQRKVQQMTEGSSPKARILLIDDEKTVLFALKLLLQALGYVVIDFSEPEAAIAFAQTNRDYDVCICDLRMYTLNGLEVLEAMRKIEGSPPFVLMSAHATDDETDAAKDLGAAAFISKPFTPEELNELIARVVPKS